MPLPSALHRVQLIKQEWEDLGGDAGDEAPYSSPIEPEEDAVELAGVVVQRSGARDEKVGCYRQAGVTADDDDLVLFDPVTGGKTLAELLECDESSHEALDTLTHEIVETSYEEYTYTAGQVTNVTVWETVSKLKKIREETYTYSGVRIDQIVIKQYDPTGSLKETVTEDYTYSGKKVTSIDRVKS